MRPQDIKMNDLETTFTRGAMTVMSQSEGLALISTRITTSESRMPAWITKLATMISRTNINISDNSPWITIHVNHLARHPLITQTTLHRHETMDLPTLDH